MINCRCRGHCRKHIHKPTHTHAHRGFEGKERGIDPVLGLCGPLRDHGKCLWNVRLFYLLKCSVRERQIGWALFWFEHETAIKLDSWSSTRWMEELCVVLLTVLIRSFGDNCCIKKSNTILMFNAVPLQIEWKISIKNLVLPLMVQLTKSCNSLNFLCVSFKLCYS